MYLHTRAYTVHVYVDIGAKLLSVYTTNYGCTENNNMVHKCKLLQRAKKGQWLYMHNFIF